MSGRTRVTLSDGRRVTGYRKTLARRVRTPPHLMPDWTLSFEMPGLTGATLLPGFTPGLIGVRVGPLPGHVTITGKNKDWVLGQTIAFLRTVAPDGLPAPLPVRLTRATETGPTLSGPLRRGEDRVSQIVFDGHRASLIGLGEVRSERKLAAAPCAWPRGA